jgi:hypothetical protein
MTRLGPTEGHKGRPLNRLTYVAIMSRSTSGEHEGNYYAYRDPKSPCKSKRQRWEHTINRYRDITRTGRRKYDS